MLSATTIINQRLRARQKERTSRRASAKAAELGHLSLRAFFARISPELAPPDHLAPLLRLFERIARGERVRAVVSIPPQHGKTLAVLHALVWFLCVRPSDSLAYVTYSDGQATSKSDIAQDIAARAGIDLRRDTLGEWRTSRGGGCLWGGIGGKLTGQPARALVVDDPFKNRDEADSPARRAKVLGWFKSVAMTRGQEGMSILVIHTRWNRSDLIGTLREGECGRFEVVSLPFLTNEAGEADEAGTRVLNPLRVLPDGYAFGWTVDGAQQQLRDVGEYDAASVYQCEPRPKGGKVFAKLATRFTHLDLNGARILLAVDPAGGEGATANRTVAVALAVWDLPSTKEDPGRARIRADLVGLQRWQGRPENVAPGLYSFQRRFGGPLHIEASRDGRELARVLKLIEPRLVITLVAAVGSKFNRAQPLAAAWNDPTGARFRVPLHARLIGATEADLADYLRVVDNFTGNDAEDDDVDATAHGFNLACRATTAGASIAV